MNSQYMNTWTVSTEFMLQKVDFEVGNLSKGPFHILYVTLCKQLQEIDQTHRNESRVNTLLVQRLSTAK